MSADGWLPELVVGVDFGMTCTGVAYSMGPSWGEPKTLQHWPGKMINELANKVPTLLQYAEGSKTVKNWGFLCDQDDEEADILACFKLHLDPEYRDPRPDAPKRKEVKQWFKDYLRSLHDHIEEFFSNSYPRWRSQRTSFVFSVPTTWRNPAMIAATKSIIEDAGFGSDGLDHRVEIGLTEAEAAAVYASKQQFEKDDVILVCDAGGGTTDVNVLKMTSSRGEAVQLEQLSWVEGRPIGSTLIDINFHSMISERLSKIASDLKQEPQMVADGMIQGRFERMKCSFGTAASSTIPTIPLPVPGLEPGCSFPDANIVDSKMIITRDELKELFDSQIKRVISLMDEQFDRMQKNYTTTQISHLVLSGGLGSSPYVRQCLRSQYDTGPGSSRPNTLDMKIVTVAEPQLAVVQGLVINRIQVIKLGNEVFKERCCRLSYGVLCLEEYKPLDPRHLGQKVTLDSRDGKKWVENQIHWFIKQGERISIEGISQPYVIKIPPGKESGKWLTGIVMSTLPAEHLPSNINQDGVEKICTVHSVLKESVGDAKLKNRHWYNRGEKYLRLRFNIKVILGAADIRFQLHSKDGQILSGEHNAIQVKWETPARRNEEDDDGLAVVYRAP